MDEEEARKERKRLKKQARLAAELQAQEDDAPEQPAEEDEAAAAQRKAAKKQEKKRRREQAAAAAQAADAQNAHEAAPSGEKRPKTKGPHEVRGCHSDPPRAAMAAVGDKSAATTGERFKKDFFVESPALVAMSQSVRSKGGVTCAAAGAACLSIVADM